MSTVAVVMSSVVTNMVVIIMIDMVHDIIAETASIENGDITKKELNNV